MFLCEDVNKEIRKKQGELFGESIILENLADFDNIVYTEGMLLSEASALTTTLHNSATRFVNSIKSKDLNVKSNMKDVSRLFNNELKSVMNTINIKALTKRIADDVGYDELDEEGKWLTGKAISSSIWCCIVTAFSQMVLGLLTSILMIPSILDNVLNSLLASMIFEIHRASAKKQGYGKEFVMTYKMCESAFFTWGGLITIQVSSKALKLMNIPSAVTSKFVDVTLLVGAGVLNIVSPYIINYLQKEFAKKNVETDSKTLNTINYIIAIAINTTIGLLRVSIRGNISTKYNPVRKITNVAKDGFAAGDLDGLQNMIEEMIDSIETNLDL